MSRCSCWCRLAGRRLKVSPEVQLGTGRLFPTKRNRGRAGGGWAARSMPATITRELEVASRRRLRRCRAHADLRRPGARVAVRPVSVGRLDEPAGAHAPRSSPARPRRGPGHRHRLAVSAARGSARTTRLEDCCSGRGKSAAAEQLGGEVRLRQEPLVRALGNQIYEVRETAPGEPPATTSQAQPLLRTGARALQIADLVEPVEANPNLQALALEQVRYAKDVPLVALVAADRDGVVLDLTERVSVDRRLDWTAPPGRWTVYGVFLGWHGKLVERAAPGGEGNVIDHFSRDAIRRYLARFDRAFSGRQLSGIRAFFNDSYEVDDATGQADGTPSLFEGPAEGGLRHSPAAAGAACKRRQRTPGLACWPTTVRRCPTCCWSTFTAEWNAWAHRHDALTRNQAHGSPGESARPVRGQRHPGDRGHRDRAQQVGGVGWPCRRPPADRGGSRDLARRAFSLDARRHSSQRRSLLRRGRQSHRLPRHSRVAGECRLARVALLRLGRAQRSQSVVARSAGAQSIRHERPVVPAVRGAGSRRAALLPVLRLRRHGRDWAAGAFRRRECARRKVGIRGRA